MNHTYSIQAVAERTGLSPHVIRAWERRYGAIEPERSAGKHRLYSAAEVERLTLLRHAVERGHSISKVARLSGEELLVIVATGKPTRQRTAHGSASDPAEPFRGTSMKAVEHFDTGLLDITLRDALVTLGHNGFLRLVVAPLAQEIGERWARGELTAGHEHFFTASAKILLGDLTRQFATPLSAPRIVVGTPTGQHHELGAMMAAAVAANLGWRTIYLGPGLPAHEIAGAALRSEASAVALSIVYPEDDPDLPRDLTDLAGLLPSSTRLIVGGRASHGYFETLIRIGAIHIGSIGEFVTQLDSIRSRSSAAKKGQPA